MRNQGEIWLANLNPGRGTEPGKIRPVLILQNQALLDAEHPSTLIIPLTTNLIDDAEPLRNPDQGAGTSVLERPETKESPVRDDGGDADRFAHYVSKDRIAESRATGRPVVALCGKVWVPKHDPSKYPVCPDCKRIYEEMTR